MVDKPKRKYYKNDASADALKTTITFVCPNTGDLIKMDIEYEYQFSGYSDRLGDCVDVEINPCPKCRKRHTIYLRND